MVNEKGVIQFTDSYFVRLYEIMVKKSPTYIEAYETTELIHEEICGARRYSDYDSFRHVKNRMIKKD